jgi:phosphatidylinositol glycan class K
MSDTCQASTLHTQFYSPNIVAIGSSRQGENSYSVCYPLQFWFTLHAVLIDIILQHTNDASVGVSLLDRFTFATLDFFQTRLTSTSTLHDLFSSYNPGMLYSHPQWRLDLFQRNIAEV